MKQYYIPTSSMNFNNILSSESISPKAFYPYRSFGYGRWTSIPENPFENSIVLYDQLCSFSCPASDYEDYPMLIEVTLDDAISQFLFPLDEHTFLYDRTIYIDPFSSRIIFFSENEMRIALSLSDSSIETKFAHLYQKKIITIIPSTSSYQSPDPSHEHQVLNTAEIEKDKRINRMKGLLYGYYIGAILSVSKDDILKLNRVREIHNILAAILSSFDHKATSKQRDRLKELYSSIYPKVPLFKELAKLISDKLLIDNIISIIRVEYGYIRDEFDVDKMISQLLVTPVSQDAKNPVIENVRMLIKQTENLIAAKAQQISVNDSQIIVINGDLTHLNVSDISDSDKVLYMAWINQVLSKDEYTGKTSTFKEAMSDDVTIKAKDVCTSEWKGSYPEITLNALRRHVRGDEFPHNWGNDIYSSISALIVRGDDWQKLLQYMQEKEMTDYRIAFSMYGTVNGFANLPRDFTDVLFAKESKYIAEVYKEFYGQLFGRNVIVATKSDIAVTEPVSQAPNKTYMSDFEKAVENKIETTQGKPTDKPSDTVSGFDDLMSKLIKKCTGAKNDKAIYKELYEKNGGLSQDFFDAVCKNSSLCKGKGAQRGVRVCLDKLITPPKKVKTNRKKELQSSSSIFTDQSTEFFLKDFDFLTNNSEFNSIASKIEIEWKKELKWFIDAHEPDHRDYSKYYKDKPIDNKTVVDQFLYLNKSKYSITKDLLYRLYKINE